MEKYEILSVVGEGSYGVVVKCVHRATKRLVAVKKLIDVEGDHNMKKMALREIRILKQLHHENVISLLEVFKRKRRFYLVFEYLERTVLADLEKNPDGLGDLRTRQYMFQVVRALDYCHTNNIIHRDIKPENLLVSSTGILKLCDFGFARPVTMTSSNAAYTEYIATRWYRAPELLIGDRRYGKPVDVWALGCVFAELLTGSPLFPGDSDVDQLFQIVNLLGKLTYRQQKLISRNHVFSDIKYNEQLRQSVHKIAIESLSVSFPSWRMVCVDIVSSCLQLDPDERATASTLLCHEYFNENNFAKKFIDEIYFKMRWENWQSIVENSRNHPESPPIKISLSRKCNDAGNRHCKPPHCIKHFSSIEADNQCTCCYQSSLSKRDFSDYRRKLDIPPCSENDNDIPLYVPTLGSSHLQTPFPVECTSSARGTDFFNTTKKITESKMSKANLHHRGEFKNKSEKFVIDSCLQNMVGSDYRINFPDLTAATSRTTTVTKLNSTYTRATHFKQFH